MNVDTCILIGFGILLALYIVYSYNKNKSINDEEYEQYTDDYDLERDEDYLDGSIICDCPCHNDPSVRHIEPCCGPNRSTHKLKESPDIFPFGRSFLINHNTGLNKFGCNCVCHDGRVMDHIVPCCGIKEVCGCPCHSGIDVDHNTKCCDSAIIK